MTSATQARCDEFQGAMIAYLGHELGALERRRISAHLRHCKQCSTAQQQLDMGVSEARRWQPVVSPAHLEHLNARLQPYLPAERSALPVSWLRLGAMAAGAVAMITVGITLSLQERTTPHTTVVSLGDPVSLAPARHQPSRYLNLVASHDWDGKIEGEPSDMAVSMSSGFAVFAFEGGNGRRLRVSAPDALVEVVGTRFFVESKAGVTKIGVAEGKVRVLTLRGARFLNKGETMVASGAGDGTDARALQFIDDVSLLEKHTAHKTDSAPSKRTPRRAKAATKDDRGNDILSRLSAAEELARLGAFREAIGAYRAIASDPSSASFKDHCRYEIARIWGFELGEVRRAQSMLRPLASHADGEIGQQAALAMCELMLEKRPCLVVSCLDELQAGADVQLQIEARRLFTHWGLAELRCGE